ncbi:acyl carrier protein [Helicobacter sp. MIT 05-5294]|uniref:acyl carrier protein n=1 Tax=Helicobacter sp. MIT 05-5294 TaxID=1548150 RepID=UPI00051FAE2F|nr:acyl carrier protein [Helicobacter sp. MIT 05-5294]TLD85949.1 acyl carrier protein [Helicobacter sp. MIT 05-5294]
MNELEKLLKESVAGIDTQSQDFIGDGFLDSFALMSLIAALEERYQISIFDSEIDIDDYTNLDSICDFLRKKGVKI